MLHFKADFSIGPRNLPAEELSCITFQICYTSLWQFLDILLSVTIKLADICKISVLLQSDSESIQCCALAVYLDSYHYAREETWSPSFNTSMRDFTFGTHAEADENCSPSLDDISDVLLTAMLFLLSKMEMTSSNTTNFSLIA